MSNIFIILVACVVVMADDKINPNWDPLDPYKPLWETVSCDAGKYERSEVAEASKCTVPKLTFVDIRPAVSTTEEVFPAGAWVKRCIGYCYHPGLLINCTGATSVTRMIPITIFDWKTQKERCSSYPLEEHVTCRCCDRQPSDCIAPKVFYHRKCTCRCGNNKERKACIARAPYQEWNAHKCKCIDVAV